MDLNFFTNLGLLFLVSLFFGRLANLLKAPRLVGYLAAGVLFGPYVLGLFSENLVDEMQHFTEMALSIIAFSIGASMKLKDIKRDKKVIIGVAVAQALLCSLLVAAAIFGVLFFFYSFKSTNNILGVSIILGAISAATAPAAILSLVREYQAKGPLTRILLGVIALDDAITIVLYSIALSLAQVLMSGKSFEIYSGLAEPFLQMLGAIGLGLAVGFVIKHSIRFFPGREVLLGIILGAVFLIAGIANLFGFSHLLAIMTFAFFIENYTDNEFARAAYEVVDQIEEPILGVFFLLAGAHLNLNLATSAGFLIIVLLLFRSAGKYGGSFLGANATHAGPKVKKLLGIALLPSAGVAIGLVMDARTKLSDFIPELSGIMVSIIIGQTLFNEFISPFLVKYVLRKSGEIPE